MNGIQVGVKPILNCKGHTMGNGLTNNDFDLNSRIPFAYGMVLIQKQLYNDLKETRNGDY